MCAVASDCRDSRPRQSRSGSTECTSCLSSSTSTLLSRDPDRARPDDDDDGGEAAVAEARGEAAAEVVPGQGRKPTGWGWACWALTASLSFVLCWQPTGAALLALAELATTMKL